MGPRIGRRMGYMESKVGNRKIRTRVVPNVKYHYPLVIKEVVELLGEEDGYQGGCIPPSLSIILLISWLGCVRRLAKYLTA